MQSLRADQGLLYHLILQLRPDLARHIKETGEIDTIVVGLGREGTRHAGLMKEYGTRIVAGIAPGEGGTRIHETIPVYDTVAECLKDHPYVAAASIWKQFSMAKESVIETIEAGIPLVVLITEGIPLRDVREMLTAARRNRTALIGGNSPGVIFPPEQVKIGMLPDVFYPEEKTPGKFGPNGVTIISRSGAILYHMSDALASVGIAQNAVIGIGGDAAIGFTFMDLVPLVMNYPHTDLVVIAGEVGGIQEERLAEDILAHPERYPKPIVALVSGAHAPEGKTMGHAGAIVSPGQNYGTFNSKKEALGRAGVTVVNSQYDLIEAVKTRLNKTYFDPERYYQKMRQIWDAKVAPPSWGTLITEVKPNNLMISGYPLQQIIGRKGLLDVANLLIDGEFANSESLEELRKIALAGALESKPSILRYQDEDISQTIARALICDETLAAFSQTGRPGPRRKTAFALGRLGRYLASILGTATALDGLRSESSFTELMYRTITGNSVFEHEKGKLIEAMSVASVDHGVTPPSAQVAIISASTRADYAMSVASGVGAITDVHGGAGSKAAQFFSQCVSRSKKERIDLKEATEKEVTEYIRAGLRIEGLGHRVHTQDPRRDALWKLSEAAGVAGENVAVSKIVSEVFKRVRGMDLPINVDGVIGSIVADMGLNPVTAKALFIWGRVAGLSAHYFEEILSQPEMRIINFTQAVYKGKAERELR
ncbi:MAG TPA: citrate/2-methylcitrate synthase [archaeon]|nr:citrate/2-methylcitrate synthase [archaeon]